MPVIIQPSPGGGSVTISDSAGVPAGGADGQYLRKASAANYDTEWSDSTTSWGGIDGALSAQADLQAALDAKASASHSHAISDVTGLQTALDGKQASGSYAAASHSHAISDVTGLQTTLDAKLDDSQLDTDTTLAANSDTKIATQKAVKAYVDANAGASGDITTSGLTMVTGKILGRGTASTGAIEEITLGTNLSLSGTTLNAAGGSGTDMFAAGKTFRAAYGKFNATTTSDLGLNLTGTGLGSLTAFSNTDFLSSLSRSRRSTTPTAENFAGWRDADFAVIRRSGFKLSIFFAVSAVSGADIRVFAGLVNDSLLGTDEDPVDFDSPLGFGLDAADSNWQRFENNGNTGATKTDTGIALTAGDPIEITIECEAGGSSAIMTLKQWTGTSATVANTYGPVTVSSNLPSATTALYPYLWVNNNGTAAAAIIDLMWMKIIC